MVYADANCLLRFILNDNQEMADYTENLLNTQEVFLLHEVLCEMVYVLDGVYKTSRKDINKQLSALLDFVIIEDSDFMKNAQIKRRFFYYALSSAPIAESSLRTFSIALSACSSVRVPSCDLIEIE